MNLYEISTAYTSERREKFLEAVYMLVYENRVDDLRSAIEKDPTLAGIANDIFESDPTPNKAYIDWIIKILRIQPSLESKKDALKKIAQMLPLYNNNKANIPEPYKNIANIRSLEHFADIVNPFQAETKESKAEQARRQLYGAIFSRNPLNGLVEGKGNEYVKIYEDDEWLAYSPLVHQASSIFGQVTDWCTNFSENAFRDRGGNEGGLIYIFNKDYEKREGNYAIETLKSPGAVKVSVWDYKNDEIIKNMDYKTAISGLDIPAQVKTALDGFIPAIPTPLQANVQKQMKKLIEFVGTQSHPQLENFIQYASNLFDADAAKGLTILHAGIDLGGTSYRMWEALARHERQLLENMSPEDYQKFNRAFQRANHDIGMDASPDNIDEYLEMKYTTIPRREFENIKREGEGAGGTIFYYFGTIGEGYINLSSKEEWFRMIYPYYHIAESLIFIYNRYRNWYDFIMAYAFRGQNG